jgi:hypothetical protein
MKIKTMKHALLAGLLLCAAGIMTVQANTIVTFSVNMATNLANGTFNPPPPDGTGTDICSVRGNFLTNAWSVPGLVLVRQGSSTVWTNTYDVPNTSMPNGRAISYRFTRNGTDSGNESTASWDNRAVVLPLTSGASLAPPTPYFGDVGPGATNIVTFQVDMSEQIVLNHFTNGVSPLDIRGSFNGWGNTGLNFTRDPSILVTNYNPAFPPGGIVTSNVYVITVPIEHGAQVAGTPATNSYMQWKAVMNGGSWETGGSIRTNFNDNDNRFWCNNTNQVLPIVSFSDLPYAPLAQARLNVDMSAVALFDPNYVYPSVTVWGTFNNWANGVDLTNNPAAVNTNIFSGIITVVQGAENTYQFRYTNSYKLANNIDSGWVYDFVDGIADLTHRRTLTVPSPITSTNIPVVFFNGLSTNDYLTMDTVVTFSVNMTNAVGSEGHVFDPINDTVYINGDFDGNGWFSWNPIALAGRVCNNNPPGSQVYSFQYTFPQGHQRRLEYQYSTSYSVINTTTGDETLSGLNHVRYIRGTSGNYTLPLDTFGSMIAEPKFGNLAIGPASGGSLPVTWLGYPGVYLQSRTNLISGTWQNNLATGGQNSTNWPNSSGNQFFRLVQP